MPVAATAWGACATAVVAALGRGARLGRRRQFTRVGADLRSPGPLARPLLAVVCALSLWACGPTSPDADAAKDALADADAADGTDLDTDVLQPPPWPVDAGQPFADGLDSPDAWPLPPACSPTLPGLGSEFAVPKLPKSFGLINIDTPSRMAAVGHTETMPLYVYLPSGASIDADADGPLQLQTDEGTEVLQAPQLVDGRASLQVRFATAGPHKISLTLDDGRQGQHWFYAYVSALPAVELTMEPAALEEMIANPYVHQYHPCSVQIDGKLHTGAQIRLHGASSSDLVKRSFRVKLAKGDKFADGGENLILRSEYIDKTLLRTWLSYQAIAMFTWLPAPVTRFVHARLNGKYYGVMLHVERLDELYLKKRGLNPNGVLYEADPPNALANPGGSLTPLYPQSDYPLVFAKHLGQASYADLISFIEETLQLPNTKLFAQLDHHIKVGDWLLYAAVMTVLQNQEHLRKNYYIYRNPAHVDDRFLMLPWDLDLTWGHLWTPQNDVFDEAIFSALPPDKGSYKVDAGFFNQMYRALDHPPWRQQWAAWVERLAGQMLDPGFVEPRIQYALCLIGPDLLADTRKRTQAGEYLERLDELRQYAIKRREFLKAATK